MPADFGTLKHGEIFEKPPWLRIVRKHGKNLGVHEQTAMLEESLGILKHREGVPSGYLKGVST